MLYLSSLVSQNTSLNIFNSKYVLASPETATDSDFNNVEGVVAHELFHNWSGNRVTINKWHELTLKEGLTMFRDSAFSADMNSAAVKRIQDVTRLRTSQFAEDAGPMAHAIRPASYITCNNFYTVTVYNKGQEVVGMLHTLAGPEGYRRGTDLYFSRNDGKAITCDDWVKAIQDANPDLDLDTFRKWYSQAGTPVVTVDVKHDEGASTMTLDCTQAIPPTEKQPTTEPTLIPIRMGLIGPDGSPVMVDLGDGEAPVETKVLQLAKAQQSFVLHNVPKGTVPSLLRGFSAPIKLERSGSGQSREELAFIMANDTDEFNRWESGQKLALDIILECIRSTDETFPNVPEVVLAAFEKTLTNENVDAALRAEVFVLPAESYITGEMEVADPVRIRAARKHVRKQLATRLESQFKTILNRGIEDSVSGEYKLDPVSQGNRALKNVALAYLAALESKEIYATALERVRSASNMTDALAALGTLASSKTEERETALSEFYSKWQNEYLVVDKWFAIQSTTPSDDVLDVVKRLITHKAFDITVPNSVYAVIGGFAASNLHMSTDGEGYKFLADQVLRLDRINPQVAARVARSFTRWRKYDETRQAQMLSELERMKATKDLSKDVYEVVTKCLP